MSDDILSVSTPFPDVASLAQGYINRVDGERLLLPLEVSCDEGAGVRFVIYLGDGTAAFAGAGRCVQVSDQGTNVPPPARYETLVDSLELDERSRPVYDYIVAVRAAAYGQTEYAAEDAGAEVDADVEAHVDAEAHAELEAHADELEVAPPSEPPIEASVEVDSDAAADSASVDVDFMSVRPGAAVESVPAEPAVEDQEASLEAGFDDYQASATADEPASSLEELPSELSEEDAEAATALASQYPDAQNLQAYSSIPAAASAPRMPSVRPGSIPTAALDSFRPEMASFIPPPLPTGILQRPARALHWQPAPPRRPTPLPQTGLFRYAGPGLPKPAAAPRPDLDPSQLVQRAPRP